MTTPLLPGACIGVIGGGQLGRMLIMEARRMGYRTCVLDPDPNCPSAQVSDDQVVAPYSDVEAARELARRADVVTYEFENVDADAVEAAEAVGMVRPSSEVLRTAQHRVREKNTLARLGFPVPAFYTVDTPQDLDDGLRSIKLPAVLKTATMGYDGKSQAVVRIESEAREAYEALRPRSDLLVLEQHVDFEKEMSVVCARDVQGRTASFTPVENIHRNGILDTTIAPAPVPDLVLGDALDLVSAITEKLEVVGLLAVELFMTPDFRLLVNELAPRPHNSGHHTLDACVTSQFEQLVRVLCGLSLGETRLMNTAVMKNLLGDVWEDAGGQPDFASALSVPGVKLHLYGKSEVRPGRKMGHLCAVAPTLDDALMRARRARDRIARRETTTTGPVV